MELEEIKKDVNRIRKEIENKNTTISRLEGRKEVLLRSLLERFKAKSVKEAHVKMKSLLKEQEVLSEEVDSVYEEIQKKMREVEEMERENGI